LSKVSKEFKIGAIVVISIALLFMGVNYLKGINLFQNQRTYYAVYDNIDGLGQSNPVMLNGFKIGLVKEVKLHPNGQGNLLVEILINDENLQIPDDTKAKIFTSDLLGSKAVDMVLGESMVMAANADTLLSDIESDLATEMKAQLAPLKAKVDDLTAGIEVIITNLQAVFEDEATQGLPEVFETLNRTMLTLEQASLGIDAAVAENRTKLNGIMGNVESITGNLAESNEDLTAVISNFESISDSLAQTNLKGTIEKADAAMTDLAEIMEKIESGEGTIGMLINNDSLHTALNQSNVELQTLINDIYTNPWRYIHVSIFGKKDKKNFSKAELREIDRMVEKALKEEE
jgi:phospholipid/cholesterol/gamma-HCH transport system substrate-binding protein